MGALGQFNQPISRWWFVALFFGTIVFLDVVAELIPYPTRLSSAITTTFAVPIQITLALINYQNVWLIFAYQFLIEAAGALFGITLYALLIDSHDPRTSRFGAKSVMAIKLVIAALLLIIPAISITKLFGPMFAEFKWSWSAVFLGSALLSVIINTMRRMNTSTRKGTDDYFGYILIGIIAFIFVGPFLYHLYK